MDLGGPAATISKLPAWRREDQLRNWLATAAKNEKALNPAYGPLYRVLRWEPMAPERLPDAEVADSDET